MIGVKELKFNKYTTIGFILSTSIIVLLILGITFGWFIGKSNDALANFNEIKTVTSGYGGRFTTEDDYIGHNDIYENANVSTKKTVKPGDVTFFTFIMEMPKKDKNNNTINYDGKIFDVVFVLNAEAVSNEKYNGESTGDFESFLSNVTIPADTATMSISQKRYDSTEANFYYTDITSYNRYTSSNTNTIRNLVVSSFYTNNAVKATIRLTLPTGMSYPISYSDTSNSVDDGNIYFMVYVPILYKDTNSLQNNEMNSYVKISSLIYEEVSN